VKYGVKRRSGINGTRPAKPAFARERAIKKWNRAWKIEMIERFNPHWDDLFDQLDAN